MKDARTPAACYVRTATHDPDRIAEQIRACRAFAEANGLTVPDEFVFADDGYPGASFDRPGWQRLNELALGGDPPFQVLLATEPSRIARSADPAATDSLEVRFSGAGVAIVYVWAPSAAAAPVEVTQAILDRMDYVAMMNER